MIRLLRYLPLVNIGLLLAVVLVLAVLILKPGLLDRFGPK